MWRTRLMPVFFVSLGSLLIYGQEMMEIKEFENLEAKMEAKEVFFKMSTGFDADDQYLYIIDNNSASILKVEIKSGKLAKIISRKGQGPGELAYPFRIVLRNGRLFVYDSMNLAIKIFDCEGGFISEFKLKSQVNDIDVTTREEIYLCENDPTNNTAISVYDNLGNKRRSLVVLPDYSNPVTRRMANFKRIKIDIEGNIFILLCVSQELAKYGKNGELIWRKSIQNKILPKPILPRETNATFIFMVFDIEIMNSGNIIVGHNGGGCILNSEGNLTHLIKIPKELYQEQGASFKLLKYINKKLICCSYPEGFRIIHLNEEV